MMNFADNLAGRIARLGNPSVLGLDPQLEQIPAHLYAGKISGTTSAADGPALAEIAAETIFTFNSMLIDALKSVIPAVKPQIAYYESLGEAGIRAYIRTIRYASEAGMLVIADAKRNDIGSTAALYSQAFLGETSLPGGVPFTAFGADALTVNPYLGEDGIAPFISDCARYGKGLFVLVRTSNPSAGDFQDLQTGSGFVYEAVARKVDEWGRGLTGSSGYSSVGAVVGATWPEQAQALRLLMPRSMFLVPGYGAQGGSGDTAAACFDGRGGGAVINASRSLMYAYRKGRFAPEDFQEAAYREAIRMRDDLNEAVARRLERKE